MRSIAICGENPGPIGEMKHVSSQEFIYFFSRRIIRGPGTVASNREMGNIGQRRTWEFGKQGVDSPKHQNRVTKKIATHALLIPVRHQLVFVVRSVKTDANRRSLLRENIFRPQGNRRVLLSGHSSQSVEWGLNKCFN